MRFLATNKYFVAKSRRIQRIRQGFAVFFAYFSCHKIERFSWLTDFTFSAYTKNAGILPISNFEVLTVMKVIVCKDYNEMSSVTANIIAETVKNKPNCVLGLATGSTPVGAYEKLARMYESGELDFSCVKSYNLDEYYPMASDDIHSYHYFMDENLFSKINIKPENVHVPDGDCDDVDAMCADYEAAIAGAGGIDLQLLGIGRNGHIGFNEPGEWLHPDTHKTMLTADTMDANSRFFEDGAPVPDAAVTMGMGTILRAHKIVIAASGKSKREAVLGVLSGRITTSCPASLLSIHPDVTLVCDTDAYGE